MRHLEAQVGRPGAVVERRQDLPQPPRCLGGISLQGRGGSRQQHGTIGAMGAQPFDGGQPFSGPVGLGERQQSLDGLAGGLRLIGGAGGGGVAQELAGCAHGAANSTDVVMSMHPAMLRATGQ